jgi:hypothetical protein
VPVKFDVKAHASYIVVWDLPSPVMMDSPFTVKVGVRCSPACPLGGRDIEVRDDRERKRRAITWRWRVSRIGLGQ